MLSSVQVGSVVVVVSIVLEFSCPIIEHFDTSDLAIVDTRLLFRSVWCILLVLPAALMEPV